MSKTPNKKSPSRATRSTTARRPSTPRTRRSAAKPATAPTDISVAELQGQLEEKLAELTMTNRQLKRKIFDLYTIFEISRNFNAVLDYEMLLDTFIFTCLGQIGALKGAIFLQREAHSDRLYPIKYKGSGSLPAEDDYFSAASALADYLTRLNRPVPTRELISDISSADERRILGNFEPGIVVPLIYQTRLTGIFAMSEKVSGRDFQLDDLEFLSILGNQIAVAIENARLYQGEKQAIQQLRAAQQQLLQTERLAALGEMSAKVAHEVNNPLGIIKNYVLLIQRACRNNDQANNFVGIVSEEIDRIARIVKQLLDFHRPTGLAVQRVDIVKLLDDVLRLVDRQLASHDIRIVRNYDASIPELSAAPEGLKQVFLNLIINARDAMPNGGSLSVRLEAPSKRVRISFSDTGPGIAPEHIPHIFEPFFTTKEAGGGTGLGLSVCYGIIKNHGGSISFRNLEPGGCFTIELPVAEGKIAHD
ncbi:MAG: ATP-binding protein [candidate division Zixibacteria bacterium]|jgi:signal transduction histidine kinase|nr:ATP-binding protein [candidate division Zixibacteria bacterium]